MWLQTCTALTTSNTLPRITVGELLVYLLLGLELYVHNSQLVDLLLELVDVVADLYCTNNRSHIT